MRCYSHLSDDEREQIGLAKALGHSIGAIVQGTPPRSLNAPQTNSPAARIRLSIRPDEAQAVVVATPEARPDDDAFIKRVATLQTQHHFRYPLWNSSASASLGAVTRRVELLTDDFAPVNLYETIPARTQSAASIWVNAPSAPCPSASISARRP
jgi:hypothetical protein